MDFFWLFQRTCVKSCIINIKVLAFSRGLCQVIPKISFPIPRKKPAVLFSCCSKGCFLGDVGNRFRCLHCQFSIFKLWKSYLGNYCRLSIFNSFFCEFFVTQSKTSLGPLFGGPLISQKSSLSSPKWSPLLYQHFWSCKLLFNFFVWL